MNSTLTKTGNWVSITLDIPSSGLVGYPSYRGVPQVRCLEYQDDSHNRTPVCAQHYYLNLGANKLNLKKGTIWVFPILRSARGFITATLIQLLIQRRITTISVEYLVTQDQLPVGNGDDVEAAAGIEKKNYQMAFAMPPPYRPQHLLWGMLDVSALFRIRHRPLVLSVGSVWKLDFRWCDWLFGLGILRQMGRLHC